MGEKYSPHEKIKSCIKYFITNYPKVQNAMMNKINILQMANNNGVTK